MLLIAGIMLLTTPISKIVCNDFIKALLEFMVFFFILLVIQTDIIRH